MSGTAIIVALVVLWCGLSLVIALIVGRAVAIRDARDRSAQERDHRRRSPRRTTATTDR